MNAAAKTMRRALPSLASTVGAACLVGGCTRDAEPPPIVKTAPSEVASPKAPPPPTGPTLSPDGKPDCNVVMTVPLPPSLSAKVDGGIVRLVVSTYSQVPLATTLTFDGKTLAVAATPAGPAETYCHVPLAIRGVPPGDYEVVVTVPHTLGAIKRATDVLRAKVTLSAAP